MLNFKTVLLSAVILVSNVAPTLAGEFFQQDKGYKFGDEYLCPDKSVKEFCHKQTKEDKVEYKLYLKRHVNYKKLTIDGVKPHIVSHTLVYQTIFPNASYSKVLKFAKKLQKSTDDFKYCHHIRTDLSYDDLKKMNDDKLTICSIMPNMYTGN